MKQVIFCSLLALALGIASADTAFAATTEAEEPPVAPAQDDASIGAQTEAPPAEEAQAYPAHKFQGWVDTSAAYLGNDVGSSGRLGYQMAQIGLRMSHEIDENFGGFGQINGFSDGNNLTLRAREAYGYYQSDGKDFKLLAGKYYAPIGFELADPPDLYQFSNSLVFINMIPTELVGLMGAYQLTDRLDVKLYTSGPWDNDAAALGFGDKNFGTRVGVGLGDLGGIGLSAVGGPQSQPGLNRIALDLDGSLTPTEQLLLGFEVNANLYGQYYGNVVTDPVSGEILGGDKKGYAMPVGFLVMGNYAFTDLFNLTLRYDMVRDAAVGDDVAKEVPGAPLFGAGPDGKAVTLSSVTVAPNFHLADGWDVFTEVRYDMASQDVYTVGGEAVSGYLSGAVELIYQF